MPLPQHWLKSLLAIVLNLFERKLCLFLIKFVSNINKSIGVLILVMAHDMVHRILDQNNRRLTNFNMINKWLPFPIFYTVWNFLSTLLSINYWTDPDPVLKLGSGSNQHNWIRNTDFSAVEGCSYCRFFRCHIFVEMPKSAFCPM